MNNAKVILINVGVFREEETQQGLSAPLGIIYLGSYLHKFGVKVVFCDTRLRNKDAIYSSLKENLAESTLVGLSVMTPFIKEGLEITNFIKTINPSTKIVWGGFHATLYPESTLKNRDIDFVITGEGERGLSGLVKYLLQEKDISDVSNLAYKQGDKIIENESVSGEDLDFIGIPSYQNLDFLPYIEKSPFTQKTKIDILTSRGCNMRCAFCVNSIIHKSSWRPESIQQTCRNIDAVIKLYKIGHICFTDEDFFCNLPRIEQLLPEIAKRNITWDACCHASRIRNGMVDDSMLSKMYAAGCRGLRLGLESGSHRVLNMLNKGLSPQQSLYAVKQIIKHKIAPNVSFMMGLPDETLDEILKTLDLILRIFKIDPKFEKKGPSVFRPYPGSALFNRCVEKGLVLPQDLSSWSNFFMYNSAVVYNKDNFPWLDKPDDIPRVVLCIQYLSKQYLPAWFRRMMVGFHVKTRLKFIYIDYAVFRFFKRMFKYLKSWLSRY